MVYCMVIVAGFLLLVVSLLHRVVRWYIWLTPGQPIVVNDVPPSTHESSAPVTTQITGLEGVAQGCAGEYGTILLMTHVLGPVHWPHAGWKQLIVRKKGFDSFLTKVQPEQAKVEKAVLEAAKILCSKIYTGINLSERQRKLALVKSAENGFLHSLTRSVPILGTAKL